MSDNTKAEVPQTLEGWYVLHDVYSFDWSNWWTLEDDEREAVCDEASAWVAEAAGCERGDSAAYSVVTQKGDLMFVHYRESPAELNRVELGLRTTGLNDFLVPAYSYLSVIEVGLYEATALATLKLSERGQKKGSKEFAEAFEAEMAKQTERSKERLFAPIPRERYLCFYPMEKRRGEQDNWYTLSLDERRAMMRGHGAIGHKYHEQVTQVIGGSMGLDDWEWGVSLYADDPLVFKKLVYEMRFDEASARYAEFGQFYLGVRREPEALADLFRGTLS